MEQATCRICLAQNIRMNSIVNTPLQQVFERLSNDSLVKGDRPLVACYICYARLKHCYRLIVNCRRSEEVFTQIVVSNEQLFHSSISLSAQKLCKFNTLVVSPVQQTSTNDPSEGIAKVEPELDLESNGESFIKINLEAQSHSELNPLDNIIKKERFESNDYDKDETLKASMSDSCSGEMNLRKTHFRGPKTLDTSNIFMESKTDISQREYNIKEEVLDIEDTNNEFGVNKIDESDCESENLNFGIKQVKVESVESVKIENENDYANVNWSQSLNEPEKIESEQASNALASSNEAKPEKPYQCTICGSSFTRKGNLKQHVIIHTGIKPFKCSICQSTFVQKSALVKHTRRHTGIRPFKCDICQRDFAHKNDLQKHTRIHTGERPYQCDICHNTFKDKDQLNIHNRIHDNVKPFKCEVCHKSFRQRQNYLRHTRVHTGDKPYSCDICNTRFSQKGTLNKHVRIHNGDKPFQCEICHSSFRQKCHLESHKLIHTGEKKYRCDICQSLYKDKASLVRHIRKHF